MSAILPLLVGDLKMWTREFWGIMSISFPLLVGDLDVCIYTHNSILCHAHIRAPRCMHDTMLDS